MLVWDQCVAAGWHVAVVPATVVVLRLLRERLLGCSTVRFARSHTALHVRLLSLRW